jgi:hypothetical protein
VKRNRYLDLLRPLAIGCVVYGHWMLIGLTYYRGQFSDLNVLDYIEWGRWVASGRDPAASARPRALTPQQPPKAA